MVEEPIAVSVARGVPKDAGRIDKHTKHAGAAERRIAAPGVERVGPLSAEQVVVALSREDRVVIER